MTLGGFFGGSKGITWPDTPGKQIVGTISAVHPPEAVNDPKTGQPTDRMQVRIELITDERDPEIQFDDGSRTLYVKSYMRSAIGDALRRAGVKEPTVGGRLMVRFTHTEPPERPGLSASKHFEAAYEPPPSGTAEHFGAGAPPAAAPAVPPAVPPAAAPAVPPQAPPVSPAAAAVQGVPTAVQQVFPGAVPVAQPVKPAAISDAAWAAMDPATRATVAATMGADAAPPF